MTRLPSPSPHRPAFPHPGKRVRPKTYSVAVYLVILAVVFQIGMLVVVFWLRAMVVSVKVSVPHGLGGKPGVQALATHPLVGPSVPMPDLPSLSPIGPHRALLSVPTSSDKKERISNLNDEAKALLKQHATESARETLVEAENIDPRYPDTLENLAEVSSLQNEPARAKIYWQRLVDLGAGVGTVYAAAKDHVVLLQGHEADPLTIPSSLPRQIYIESVEKSPVETLNARAQFHLRATLVRKNPNMPLFDQKKLQPYVIFYRQVPDGSLVPDLDQRKGSFDDTFLFWNGKLEEAFGVDYFLPIPGMPSSDATPVGEYYGFVIGIYYDKALQDTRSEPGDLMNMMPLPDEIE